MTKQDNAHKQILGMVKFHLSEWVSLISLISNKLEETPLIESITALGAAKSGIEINLHLLEEIHKQKQQHNGTTTH